jgi:hypothetical protein
MKVFICYNDYESDSYLSEKAFGDSDEIDISPAFWAAYQAHEAHVKAWERIIDSLKPTRPQLGHALK